MLFTWRFAKKKTRPFLRTPGIASMLWADARLRREEFVDEIAPHARLFPGRRSERAADHEALCAAGHSLSFVAPAQPGIRCRHLRFDVRIESGALSHSVRRARRRSGHLRQFDDPRHCG